MDTYQDEEQKHVFLTFYMSQLDRRQAVFQASNEIKAVRVHHIFHSINFEYVLALDYLFCQ